MDAYSPLESFGWNGGTVIHTSEGRGVDDSRRMQKVILLLVMRKSGMLRFFSGVGG